LLSINFALVLEKVFGLVLIALYVTSKRISNKSNLTGIFALFVGQGLLVGLVIIALGLTKSIDPFVLTSSEDGLLIEGMVVTALALFGGTLTPIFIGLIMKDPVRFIIDEDYIEAVQFGGLIIKSPSFVERHPREGVTSIELSEVVKTNDEGMDTTTYSAKLIGNDGAVHGTLRGISSTGVAEEIAEAIKVNLSRNF
tara:strand:+ start:124 stop:714 length:591 start_codon:yes stop_codon:yes gene_type:complete